MVQQKSLDEIRTYLAAKSYRVIPVEKRFRRHRLDFLAIASENRSKMLLVRPSWNGVIEIRPSVMATLYDLSLSEVKKSTNSLK